MNQPAQELCGTSPVIDSVKEVLPDVAELYRQGRYLDAFEAAKPLGALQAWPGAEGLILGGRLAYRLGDARLGCAVHLRAYRTYPDTPEALYYGTLAMLACRGPWVAWKIFKRVSSVPQFLESWPLEVRCDWLAARASVLGGLRDFEAAETDMNAALGRMPDRAWLHVERSNLLRIEDRYEESLEAAHHALTLRPWYKPAVQMVAAVLVLLDRMDEAIAMLTEAADHSQSGEIHWQLAGLYREQREHQKLLDTLDQAESLLPLLNDWQQSSFAALRSDALYHLGDLGASAHWAGCVTKSEYWQQLAQRLSNPGSDRRRALLDLPFVRQHHLTCAPATLTAISRYWQRSVHHLEVAEDICYDGTPWTSERQWADDQGFVTKEFRVTNDAVIDLIDRGLPFTLTTIEASSAHLQAVVGQ